MGNFDAKRSRGYARKWLSTFGNSKKNPDRRMVGTLDEWWSWGELNPRPQAVFVQFYMRSRLICVSLTSSRSDTLRSKPVTLCLTLCQVTRNSAS